MGTINHDCVIATFNEKSYDNVIEFVNINDKVVETIFAVSPIVSNGYFTVVMFPDGSKEGWHTSNYYDAIRDQFIKFAKDNRAEIVHVRYGECGTQVKE